MLGAGKTLETAHSEAQTKGVAEADPFLDVSGRDAAQKLVILVSLAFGARVHDDDVEVHGIDRFTLPEIRHGAELGYTIKLLAVTKRIKDDGLGAWVRPSFIPHDLPLGKIDGPFNAVSVYGHAAGHTMYLERGARQDADGQCGRE